MGRGVANTGFIDALLRASRFDEYHFFLGDEGQVAGLERQLQTRFPGLWQAGAFCVTTRHALPEALTRRDYSCFHLSDCIADTVPLMRLRAALCPDRGRNIFPVTGTTHSLSYARFAPFFFSQLWQGTTGRDAVITTSTAGRGAIEAFFEAFRSGYSLDETVFAAPRLAHIPLGVDEADFAGPDTKAEEAAAVRKKYGISSDTLVLLTFARISHFSKMDVLPLLRAVKRAEALGLPKGSYVLALAGWVDAGDAVPQAYADLAGRLDIPLLLVPSPSDAVRRGLFAAADIFISPVDNPQETFGLTLLEAAVSGVAVVASDFDGYRDLVVHEKTGLLVPTLGPAATPESDALSGIWFDNQHHLQLAQQSVVSVPHLAAFVARLAADKHLRAAYGTAARERAVQRYAWPCILERYHDLWRELAAVPVHGIPVSRHPLHPGYPRIFGGYYSALLGDEALHGRRVRWTASGEAIYRGYDFPVLYAGIERLVELEKLKRVLFSARKPVLLESLLPERGVWEHATCEREIFLVLWALKHDLLELLEE